MNGCKFSFLLKAHPLLLAVLSTTAIIEHIDQLFELFLINPIKWAVVQTAKVLFYTWADAILSH